MEHLLNKEILRKENTYSLKSIKIRNFKIAKTILQIKGNNQYIKTKLEQTTLEISDALLGLKKEK